MSGFLADRGIDDQLDLAVGHVIENIRASLVKLLYALDRDSRLLDQVTCSAGRHQLKSCRVESSGDGNYFELILVVDGDKSGAGNRQRCLSAFLCLVECETRSLGNAEDLTGGSHFRSENRVYFLEHIEREDSFLDAEIRNDSFLHIRNR